MEARAAQAPGHISREEPLIFGVYVCKPVGGVEVCGGMRHMGLGRAAGIEMFARRQAQCGLPHGNIATGKRLAGVAVAARRRVQDGAKRLYAGRHA